MKDRDDYLYHRILLIVFLSALVLGCYVSVGPKMTSLIGSVGSINVMNLSGTFRVFMVTQFVALLFSLVLFFHLVTSLILSHFARRPTQDKNLWSFFRRCLGQISIGGAIMKVSWGFYFLNKSLRKIVKRRETKQLSKNDAVGRILKIYPTVKREYLKFFHSPEKDAFLRGVLSLLFWAVLSLFLALVIRWQAGTNGCEYCWLGDTQNTKEAEAKFFGYPISRFVKIPEQREFDYIAVVTDYVKFKSENHSVSGSQEVSRLSDPEFKECKTCWRRFVLGILLFYAVFLRVLLAGCYFVLFAFAGRGNSGIHTAASGYRIGEQSPNRVKPSLFIKPLPMTDSPAQPHLLLTLGFGVEINPEEIRSLIDLDPQYGVFYGNVFRRGKESIPQSGFIDSDFSDFLSRSGDAISDIIIFVDLCTVPTIDFLSEFFYQEIIRKTPRVQQCWVILSNGESLCRRCLANPVSVKQRVLDWKDQLEAFQKQFHLLSNDNHPFSLVTIDWFDSQFHTIFSDHKLKSYFQEELAHRYGFHRSGAILNSESLFPLAKTIVLSQFDRFQVQEGKRHAEIQENGSSDSPQDELLELIAKEGESQLRYLYTHGELPQEALALSRLANTVKEKVNDTIQTVKGGAFLGKQMAEDIVKTAQGDPVLFRKAGSRVAGKLFPHRGKSLSERFPEEFREIRYNALKELGYRLTEYALSLELEGTSIVERVCFMSETLKFFSSASPLIEKRKLEEILSRITDRLSQRDS